VKKAFNNCLKSKKVTKTLYMVRKEIFATKYTPSTLKIGVKKSQKCEKRQNFPHDLLVMILGGLSLSSPPMRGLKKLPI
jgi:hypothetical protein